MRYITKAASDASLDRLLKNNNGINLGRLKEPSVCLGYLEDATFALAIGLQESSVFNIADGKCVAKTNNVDTFDGFRYSNDGALLLFNRKQVVRWDWKKNSEQTRLYELPENALSVTISEDASTIMYGSYVRRSKLSGRDIGTRYAYLAKLSETSDLEWTELPTKHQKNVSAVSFDQTGDFVATVAGNNVRVLRLGQKRPKLLKSNAWIDLNKIAFSPDGSRIASSGNAKNGVSFTHVWNVQTRELLSFWEACDFGGFVGTDLLWVNQARSAHHPRVLTDIQMRPVGATPMALPGSKPTGTFVHTPQDQSFKWVGGSVGTAADLRETPLRLLTNLSFEDELFLVSINPS